MPTAKARRLVSRRTVIYHPSKLSRGIFALALFFQPIAEVQSVPVIGRRLGTQETPFATTTEQGNRANRGHSEESQGVLDTLALTPTPTVTDLAESTGGKMKTTKIAGRQARSGAKSLGAKLRSASGDINVTPSRCQVGNEENQKMMGKKKPGSIHFATRNNTVITAQAGSKAILPCVVRNLCAGTISWIRRKDYNLLTVGTNTYAGDERFQAVREYNSDDWSLQIKFVRLTDAGYYECQLTSHPPHSILLLLRVVEARVRISGPAEKFVKLGSSLELVCEVEDSPVVPEFVFWYHNDRMVNYDKGRGMNISTDLPNKKSTLAIIKAANDHSGNYSCVSSNAHPESVSIHILNDELPAAMQTGKTLRFCGNTLLLATSILLLLLASLCD